MSSAKQFFQFLGISFPPRPNDIPNPSRQEPHRVSYPNLKLSGAFEKNLTGVRIALAVCALIRITRPSQSASVLFHTINSVLGGHQFLDVIEGIGAD